MAYPYEHRQQKPLNNIGYDRPLQPVPEKKWIVALLLSIFLGTLGIDRFYLGHTWLGVGKILALFFSFGTVTTVWWIWDIVRIAGRWVKTKNFVWSDEPRVKF